MQFSLFALEMQELNVKDPKTGAERNLLASTDLSSSYGTDTLVRAIYNLDQPKSGMLLDIDGKPRQLGLALGNKFIDVMFSPTRCEIGEEPCDSRQTTVIGSPGNVSAFGPQDYLALRLLQKGDGGNVLWEYAFQELWVHFTNQNGERITNLPIGEYSRAKAILDPDKRPELLSGLQWKIGSP